MLRLPRGWGVGPPARSPALRRAASWPRQVERPTRGSARGAAAPHIQPTPRETQEPSHRAPGGHEGHPGCSSHLRGAGPVPGPVLSPQVRSQTTLPQQPFGVGARMAPIAELGKPSAERTSCSPEVTRLLSGEMCIRMQLSGARAPAMAVLHTPFEREHPKRPREGQRVSDFKRKGGVKATSGRQGGHPHRAGTQFCTGGHPVSLHLSSLGNGRYSPTLGMRKLRFGGMRLPPKVTRVPSRQVVKLGLDPTHCTIHLAGVSGPPTCALKSWGPRGAGRPCPEDLWEGGGL